LACDDEALRVGQRLRETAAEPVPVGTFLAE
jgi:hypothetical protein